MGTATEAFFTSKRARLLRPVRGQTPTASLTACGVCPLTTILIRCSRPSGVRRAFLWMAIRLSQGSAEKSNIGVGRGHVRYGPVRGHRPVLTRCPLCLLDVDANRFGSEGRNPIGWQALSWRRSRPSVRHRALMLFSPLRANAASVCACRYGF